MLKDPTVINRQIISPLLLIIAIKSGCTRIIPERRHIEVVRSVPESTASYLVEIKSAATAMSILSNVMDVVASSTSASGSQDSPVNALASIALALKNLRLPVLTKGATEETLIANGVIDSFCDAERSEKLVVHAYFKTTGESKLLKYILLMPRHPESLPYKIVERNANDEQSQLNLSEFRRFFTTECVDTKKLLTSLDAKDAHFWRESPGILTVQAVSVGYKKGTYLGTADLKISINERTGSITDAEINGQFIDRARETVIESFKWKSEELKEKIRLLGLSELFGMSS